ncbi:hypothetical protein DSO57_1024186 [Entomophthora muscae]|uniref:Uncharacterized protein n=1 Tax=Entomophthora muscae TaxID=34485 RepID=A0ACC2RTZ5_9FUNG|nr:hypothetical protein DSO57_1024186 [Entomophthora muscae]
MPASSPDLPINHTRKLFGIVYITLTGVVDTIVPAAGLWSWVRNFAFYLLKLAPLLWWALPAKPQAQVTPRNSGPAAQDWIPDNISASLPHKTIMTRKKPGGTKQAKISLHSSRHA